MENLSQNLETFYQESIVQELEKKDILEFRRVFIKVININNCQRLKKNTSYKCIQKLVFMKLILFQQAVSKPSKIFLIQLQIIILVCRTKTKQAKNHTKRRKWKSKNTTKEYYFKFNEQNRKTIYEESRVCC